MQNATTWIRRQSIGILLPLLMSLSYTQLQAESEKLDGEAMLASVAIDDLLGPITTAKAEYEKSFSLKTAKPEGGQEQLAKGESAAVKTTTELILGEKMVIEELRHQLAKHFELSGDFRVYFDKHWSDVKLNSVDWELVVTTFPSKGLRNRFYLEFELWVDGKRKESFQQSIHCEIWIDAYIAQQRIDRGTILREGLFSVKPVDSLSLYQGPVDVGTKLNDYIASTGVRPGEPLFWRDVNERPLVQKGSVIEVFAQEGLMRVTLKGKALEDGVMGQRIRIRNLQSYKDVQAEVTGINQARVYF